MSHDLERRRDEERIFDLLTDRATYGLSPSDETELATLLRARPDIDPDALDRAAAALELTWSEKDAEPLPAHVYQRILARLGVAPLGVAGARAPGRGTLLLWSGWITAIAASALAIALWRAREPRDAREALAQLVEHVDRAPDVVRIPWKPTEDPDGRAVSGELVWSASAQDGYMRFEGLAANDPSRSQYQLWIFDAARDERHPVDGGVFDVPGVSSGAATSGAPGVVVPIRARLPVHEAKLFAVTVEKPGGVVVSSRERIVALASL